MSNVPGEVGKVATSAIDAMKGSPALLAVILLQLSTLGVAFYAVEQQRERQFKREMMLLDHCLPGEFPPGKTSGTSWRDWWMVDLKKEMANEN